MPLLQRYPAIHQARALIRRFHAFSDRGVFDLLAQRDESPNDRTPHRITVDPPDEPDIYLYQVRGYRR